MHTQSAKGEICVLGYGAWGTALAVLIAKNGYAVKLWGRNSAFISQIDTQRQNVKFLPGISFPSNLFPEQSLDKALKDSDDIILAIPSSGVHSVLNQLTGLIKPTQGIAIATKGFEPQSLKLMHQLVADTINLNHPVSIISGPTFAKEVAKGLPTAVTVASKNNAFALKIASYLNNERFRAYTNDDIVGVEIGGAVKNVMAIAAGIADGLGFGANTRAALITRGLAEITRLGITFGANPKTFMGLAGLGDLVLTCTDNQSRNRRVGLALARNEVLADILEELGQVAEGVSTCEKVYHLSKKLDVKMPIVEQVYSVLYENIAPSDAVENLLNREIHAEFE